MDKKETILLKDLYNEDGGICIFCKGWIEKEYFANESLMFFRNKFGKEQTITVKTPKHIFGRWVYDFQAKKSILLPTRSPGKGSFKTTIADIEIVY